MLRSLPEKKVIAPEAAPEKRLGSGWPHGLSSLAMVRRGRCAGEESSPGLFRTPKSKGEPGSATGQGWQKETKEVPRNFNQPGGSIDSAGESERLREAYQMCVCLPNRL